MSDDIAFRILNSRRWRPEDLRSAAQREMSREVRVQNFLRQHREQMRDPMTHDIATWDESHARGSGWPWCSKCKAIVRGYGIVDDTTKYTEIEAWCHGLKQGHGQTIKIEKPYAEVREKEEGWLRRNIRMLVFYAD